MKDPTPRTTYLNEYKASPYNVDKTSLVIELDEHKTIVKNKMEITRTQTGQALVLSGQDIELVSIRLNGKNLDSNQYQLKGEEIILANIVEKHFELEIENTLNPSTNSMLEGLYKSGTIFCTQNEPEGFRRITYFIDRPDNMSVYTTKIIADKKNYPILLSNGNLTDKGDLPNGKHFATWFDPFPKPSYLYALVAGDLGAGHDTYTTKSGRKVDLLIYCDKGNEKRVAYAMEALKASMKWDEDRFGLEYDLDIYMIVAVDAFNMGAMENKGLNIFNTSCVMALMESATDDDYMKVEAVVAHEYFHNWTGNRVTCRDWFQLTLKEGLTVFRDQEFSADMNSRGVFRIAEVKSLRERQFPEDAGPNAHPIKPKSYIEINNFYTPTIYEKGSEVIRMLHTFLGEAGFQKGMKRYFELFDGKAVTTEDFFFALTSANPQFDLVQFKDWYDQVGTPVVKVTENFDKGEYSLKITQDQKLMMPLSFAFFTEQGKKVELKLLKSTCNQDFLDKGVLTLKNLEETFIFSASSKPILSLNRGFSAPIHLQFEQSLENLALLAKYDDDFFNRYEAFQLLYLSEIKTIEKSGRLSLLMKESLKSLFQHEPKDLLYMSQLLSLPSENYLHSFENPVEFKKIHHRRELLLELIGKEFKENFQSFVNRFQNSEEIKQRGERAVKNISLKYLAATKEAWAFSLIFENFKRAQNMTEVSSALMTLCTYGAPQASEALGIFYDKWKHDSLVIQKWIAAQSYSPKLATIENLKKLEALPVYDKKIPNLVRSLWYVFSQNYVAFHEESGKSYALFCEKIAELDGINPHIASFLAKTFTGIEFYPEKLKLLAKAELKKVLEKPGLSKFTYEIISKTVS
jgi:aminopeptidase N